MERKKIGVSIVILGVMGTGKTPIINKLIPKGHKRIIVFDPCDQFLNRGFIRFIDEELFFKYITAKGSDGKFILTDAVIITDEGSGVWANFNPALIRQRLSRLQHDRNIWISAFHKSMAIPTDLIDYSTELILLPVVEDLQIMKRSRPQLYNYYKNGIPINKKNGFRELWVSKAAKK